MYPGSERLKNMQNILITFYTDYKFKWYFNSNGVKCVLISPASFHFYDCDH